MNALGGPLNVVGEPGIVDTHIQGVGNDGAHPADGEQTPRYVRKNSLSRTDGGVSPQDTAAIGGLIQAWRSGWGFGDPGRRRGD